MERRILRLEIGVLLILLLNILILIIQVGNRNTKHEIKEVQVSKELPDEFNAYAQKILLKRITDSYNEKNYDEFYNIFSEWARIQISKENIENEFSKLLKMSGKILNTAFTNYEYQGFESGADWYAIYYKTKFENAIGTTKLRIRVIGANWELVGVNLNIDDI